MKASSAEPLLKELPTEASRLVGAVPAPPAPPPSSSSLAAGGGRPSQLGLMTKMEAGLPAVPADFPGALLVKPSLVSFPASDGQTAYGQLFVPAHPTGCAIIFSHGGIRRQMLTSYHYMDAYHYLYGMNQYLAGRGCVVLSVEYRSSIMQGFDFRNAPGWGFAGNSEIMDFVGRPVHLFLQVKVRQNWLEEKERYSEMGLDFKDGNA